MAAKNDAVYYLNWIMKGYQESLPIARDIRKRLLETCINREDSKKQMLLNMVNELETIQEEQGFNGQVWKTAWHMQDGLKRFIKETDDDR